jgi:hypothetical protein
VGHANGEVVTRTWSLEAVAMRRPSGEMATFRTQSLWPCSVRKHTRNAHNTAINDHTRPPDQRDEQYLQSCNVVARGKLPDAHGLVPRTGNEVVPGGIKDHPGNGVIVATERLDAGVVLNAPQLHSHVVGAGGQLRPFGVKGNIVHGVGVAFQRAFKLPTLIVPDLQQQRLVGAKEADPTPVERVQTLIVASSEQVASTVKVGWKRTEVMGRRCPSASILWWG